MLTYATAADVESWTGLPAPDDAIPLIRNASLLVGRACRNDRYAVTPAGFPSDDSVVDAMRDATCAQVELWVAAGVDPVAGPAGVEAEVSSTSIGSASVGMANSGDVDAARRQATTSLCVTSLSILRLAGLATAGVRGV